MDRFIASGCFNNKSEVIRAGLQLLEEYEANASTASREDLPRVIETALADRLRLLRPQSSFVAARDDETVARSLYRAQADARWPD